jgi:hypothetical protein
VDAQLRQLGVHRGYRWTAQMKRADRVAGQPALSAARVV